MEIRYPEPAEIQDPTPHLPPKLAGRIIAHMTACVAYLRTSAENETDRARLKKTAETVGDIFGLLSEGRLQECRDDVDALRRRIHGDAELALALIYFAFKQTGWGRMPFLWHDAIVRRLTDDARRIETAWWANEADANPVAPVKPAPVRTRAPRTDTALRIESYLHDVEEKTGVKVEKKDYWLRPTKPDGTIRYTSDREFREYQKEIPGLPSAIKMTFNQVAKIPPAKFIEGRDERRQQLRNHRENRMRG